MKRNLLFFFFICFVGSMNAQNWDKKWIEIENFVNQGLPKSALTEVATLKKEAKEKSLPNYVKATIYELRLLHQTEDQGITKYLQLLEAETKIATQPAKAIFSSYLGEVYSNYLQENSYKLEDLTNTNAYVSDSIETWSANQLLEKAFFYYQQSTDANLESFKATDYPLLISQSGDEINNKFTLFDLLAQRALSFYKNENNFLTQPIYAFQLDSENYFSNYEAFNNINLVSQDSLGGRFNALKLFQIQSKSFQKRNELQLLGANELDRIQFVNQNSTIANKQKIYKQTLLSQIDLFKEIKL